MLKYLIFAILFLQSVIIQANAITPLPIGYAALLYEISFTNGPGSHSTIVAGKWINSLTTFNSQALTKNKLVRLHPYSSDIEITCQDPNRLETCNILPGYASGNASVIAYYNAFSDAKIMPIVDIAFNYLNNNLLKTNTTIADTVASKLATQLCADDKVSGVFLDIETKNVLDNPGIFEFFRKLSSLLASSMCIDATHPKGRYMGVYLTPVRDYWEKAQAMFAGNNNAYIAQPLYDVSAFKPTPSPDAIDVYTRYVTSAVQHASTASQQYKVPYTFIVPAAASFGTFQEYGIYNASSPAPTFFQLIKDFSSINATQLLFAQTVRNLTCKNQSPYYMGMDYWAWNQYVNPGTNKDGTKQLVMPNIPDSDTVSYLQQNASCS